jgi:uncharacterized membrane protein
MKVDEVKMSYLIVLGFFIFMGVHCVSLTPSLRNRIILKSGIQKFKAVYSLIAAIGLGLLLISMFKPGEYVKEMNIDFYNTRIGLLLMANILIIAGNIPNNHIRKYLKHPMLMGIFIWSFAHYMFNQHQNHLIFFASFSLFSIIMLVFIFIRDRNNTVSIKASFKMTSLVITAAIILNTALLYGHEYFTGVKVL